MLLANHDVEPIQDSPAFTKSLDRFDIPNGRWFAEAREQFAKGLLDAKTKGATAFVVSGMNWHVRQSVASEAIERADAVMFDLSIATKGDLPKFDLTTKQTVVLDGVRKDNGSETWALAFARRHREKLVILLLEQGDPRTIFPLVNDRIESVNGRRIDFLDLDRRTIQADFIQLPPQEAAADGGASAI